MDKVSTKETECANNSDVCFNEEVMTTLKQHIDKDISDSECIDILKKYLSCTTQYCVAKKREIVDFLNKKNITISLENTFKPSGPKNSTRWLDNYNIDDTLAQWKKTFPDFYHCEYACRDFAKVDAMFNRIDITNLPGYNSFACVLNTDVSTGNGEHWVCIFVDLPVKTIEYFNSVGNPPMIEISDWVKRFPSFKFVYNRLQHQQSNTECGVYVLYYIRYRLEKNPYSYIFTHKIIDSEMYKYRKHLFR